VDDSLVRAADARAAVPEEADASAHEASIDRSSSNLYQHGAAACRLSNSEQMPMKPVTSVEMNEVIESIRAENDALTNPPELEAMYWLPEVQDMSKRTLLLMMGDPLGTAISNIAFGIYIGMLIQQARQEKQRLEDMFK
jgi:hypothetical protein